MKRSELNIFLVLLIVQITINGILCYGTIGKKMRTSNEISYLRKKFVKNRTIFNQMKQGRFLQKRRSRVDKLNQEKTKKNLLSIETQNIKKLISKRSNQIPIIRNDSGMYRLLQMKKIQNSHTWRMAKPERFKGQFSKIAAKGKNRHANSFMAYLGFLADSARKGNVNVLENEMSRYYS